MTKPPAITPPFAWLGRYWTPVGLALITGTAAFFRFYQLGSLPPGLDETSARIGVQALQLDTTHGFPALNTANGYSALWVWLQAAAIGLFGHTALSLRLWAAVLGTLAVVATWLWLRDWFSPRIAWVGALTLAVSPWAVTLSRGGLESALPPVLIPLTLWLCGRVMRQPSLIAYAALGAALALNLLSGPIGWIFTLAIVGIAVVKSAKDHNLLKITRARLVGSSILALGLAVLAYLTATSFTNLKSAPHALGLVKTAGAFADNIVKVLLMFNVHGDENYRHNLAGEPLLNAFVGLMLIAGLLVSISRLHRQRYRILLLLAFVMLSPALLAGAGTPNASWAVGAMPFVFAFVGLGTSYMLELWYATFPINSAARATGQAAIILLLALSLLQGYTQYFRAWAGSTAVYVAYNEGTTQMATHLRTDKFNGERFVVVGADQVPVFEYLDHDLANYRLLDTTALAGLPIATASREFYIATSTRDAAVKILKAKFPGGVLHPHYSGFNQIEIYYTYETTK
ncbi:MAG TPA: glycosyltransferase family 39 protein [Candidatus Saccharimonadia bacterium]|nr:glycosyltransferase family 39 protein [Candidatus Saccharimonadia bacterium]